MEQGFKYNSIVTNKLGVQDNNFKVKTTTQTTLDLLSITTYIYIYNACTAHDQMEHSI